MAKTGFLDLPAELRNRIYELNIPYRQWGFKKPAIAEVCRQVRVEALDCHYRNVFYITMRHLTMVDPHPALRRFLQNTSAENLAKVEKIWIEHRQRRPREWFAWAVFERDLEEHGFTTANGRVVYEQL